MNKLWVLLAVIGCCLAAPNREAKSFGVAFGGVQVDGPTVEQPVAQERHDDFHKEHEQSYPEFGVKVDVPRVRKVVSTRARAIAGHGYNHKFNYVQKPTYYAPEVGYQQPVVSVKALVSPYQQKPLYQANRENYQPSYQQSFNQYFNQQRAEEVAHTLPAEVSGPIYPNEVQPAADNKVPSKPVAILTMNQDVNYDGTFVYDFEAENGIKSAVSGSTKRVEGYEKPVQVMSGSYSYFSPEGEPVETRWYADETGFHAEGSHLPIAPPVPEAIQRAVEYLKTLPPKEDEVAYQPLPVNPNVEVSPQRFDQTQQYNKYPDYQQKYESSNNYHQPNYEKYPTYQQRYESYPAQQ